MRRKLAAGNWKMNGLSAQLAEIDALCKAYPTPSVDLVIAPPATLLSAMVVTAADHALQIAGQDCHAAEKGAHTGDISAPMLKDAGASHVILGHSERRTDHKESDDDVREKARAALAAGLNVILCIGESLHEREAANTLDIIAGQLAASLPVIIIARLLGVPEDKAPDLLMWSNAMVRMYMAGRTRGDEDAAARAAQAFSDYLTGYIDARRAHPADDLITHLIAAEEDGEKLTTAELITTCILLLNAGHEATVHTLGNGIKTALQTGTRPGESPAYTEEVLRHDPPLHMFTRYAMQDVDLHGHSFKTGDRVGLLLGAANRDPDAYPDPHRFDPARSGPAHTSFGGGLHFCVGAPLARLELGIAMKVLFERCPALKLADPPHYAKAYHFHGLINLKVSL